MSHLLIIVNIVLDNIEISKIVTSGRKILEYGSDSSSDHETSTLVSKWRAQDIDNSDNESIDSQNEDLLKYVCPWAKNQWLFGLNWCPQIANEPRYLIVMTNRKQ